MSDDTPDTNFKVIDTRSPETRARVAGDHFRDVTKMIEEELKPCPFCGEEGRLATICDVTFYVTCPKCCAGVDSYTNQQEAIAAWNRRAPEPMTSVVRWTRYDGTHETLPEEGEPVRLSRGKYEVVCLFEGYWVDTTDSFAGHPQSGELWAYLPQPPEGAE